MTNAAIAALADKIILAASDKSDAIIEKCLSDPEAVRNGAVIGEVYKASKIFTVQIFQEALREILPLISSEQP